MKDIRNTLSQLSGGIEASIARSTIRLWFLSISAIAALTWGCGNSDQPNSVEAGSGGVNTGSNTQAVEKRAGSGGSTGLGGSGSGSTGGLALAAGNGGAGSNGSAGNAGSSGSSISTSNASAGAGSAGYTGASAQTGSVAGANAATDAGEPPAADASLEDGATEPCKECCEDGFVRTTAASSTTPRLINKFDPSPEGVAVCPNGDVFVAIGSSGDIQRVRLDGAAPELWTTLEGRQPAGLTCDRQGRLFVAQYGGTPAPPQIIMIAAKGDPGTPLPALTGGSDFQTPNGIVAINGLGVYVSDSTGNFIARYIESSRGVFEGKIAAQDVAGANGLAYDPKARKLYVGLSLNNKAASLTVAQDGSLGTPKDVWTGGDILGWVDGVAVDEQGQVYVAYYLSIPGKIIRISDKKEVAILTDVSPASLAFRGSTLLITDYKLIGPTEGGLYAIDLGICGMLAR